MPAGRGSKGRKKKAEKDYSTLLRRANEAPGVAAIMKLYHKHAEVLEKAQSAGARRSVISLTSNSTG
jgi:hypothetical protein